MSERPVAVDPATGIPYATVPDALQTNYDFLNSCAIYFCGVVEQQLLIPSKNKEKRESVVLFVTNDSIYTGNEAGELYRRVDFNAIRGIVTNSDHISRTLVNDRESLFTAFVLSRLQENEDLVIVAELGYIVAVIVERLLLARGCPVATRKVAVDNTRQLTEVIVRLPPSPKPDTTTTTTTTTTTMDSDANREITQIEQHRQKILRDSIPRRRLVINAAQLANVTMSREHLVTTLARVADAERRSSVRSDEAPISPIIRSCFPPFKDVSLFWGGTVLFFAEPKQQPQHAVLFVSLAQVVVVQEKQPVRVLPLNDISFIVVLTVNAAEKRRSIAFMSKSRDVDICVMAVGQDSDTLLKQLHLAFCTNDPTNSPPFRSIESTKEVDLQVKPRKHYQQPTVALPPTSEAVQYRNYVYSRVVDILRLCEPSSVNNATSLTEQYLGRELELLSMLYNIYPEYNTLQEKREITSKVTSSETKRTYRERLLLFCTKYIPDSTGIVDEVLNRYENREEELFYHLIQRYGPEPRETEAQLGKYSTDLSPKEVRERLVQFYRKYEPNKIADVDAIMSIYKGREELLFDRLTLLYGPMPPNTNVSPLEPSLNDGEIATTTSSNRPSWRNRLDAFLARYAPDRSGESEELLKKYAGHEDAFFCALEAKYGPEPVWVTERNRARVVAFFVRADLPIPEEKEVDTMIQSFRGTEEEFFFHLQQQYGAEHPLQFPQEPEDVSTETFEKVDLLTDIPFMEVPELLQPLFPSFVGRAALLWFGRVLHWEQPQPPTLRCAYLTSSHVYIGNSESDTVRCIALEKVESVYINSKRDRSDLQSCLLLKVQEEHDLFFAFSSDAEAQHLVMTLASVLTQYHFGRKCRVLACSNFTNPEININCWRPPTYMNRVVSVVQRPRITKRSEGSLSVNGNTDNTNASLSLSLEQEECKLRSRLHDALVLENTTEKNMDLVKDAALANRSWDTIHHLVAKEKRIYGSVPLHSRSSAAITSNNSHPPLLQSEKSLSNNFLTVANVSSQMNRLNPLQRAQFLKHSPNATYGLGVNRNAYNNGNTMRQQQSSQQLMITGRVGENNTRTLNSPGSEAYTSLKETPYRPSITLNDSNNYY